MLPGFFASSSLYPTRHVYRGYGALATGDTAQIPPTHGFVTPANGEVPSYWCSDDSHCPAGSTCCTIPDRFGTSNGFCFDLQSDPDNCGSCLNSCQAWETCCNGRCIAQRDDACGCPARSCQPGHRCCDVTIATRDGLVDVFKCIDADSDRNNCGSCGNQCPPGQSCCGGKCCSTPCCGGQCCSHFAKCMNGRCCYPEDVIATAAAILCIFTLGSDCDAIFQQLQAQACP